MHELAAILLLRCSLLLRCTVQDDATDQLLAADLDMLF
jgi:hypothetical protein